MTWRGHRSKLYIGGVEKEKEGIPDMCQLMEELIEERINDAIKEDRKKQNKEMAKKCFEESYCHWRRLQNTLI